jgi:Alginate export
MTPVLRVLACALLMAVSMPPSASAQAAAPESGSQPAPATTWTLRDTTRTESWSFFEPVPGPSAGNPDYTFVANRLFASVRHARRSWEISGALQYVQFGGLPDDAIGPGALGTGALYWDHSHDTTSSQVYLKSLQLRLMPAKGVSIALGRMGYTSGAEIPSGTPAIEAVKRQRLDSRVFGEFEWSLYQRAFDGARVDVDRKAWHVTGAVFLPTQGGFEEAANVTIRDIVLASATVGIKPAVLGGHTEVQVFGYDYDDTRPVQARPDNHGLPASAVPGVDVHLFTYGGSLVGVYPRGPGEVDVLAWSAGQAGHWFDEDHRAFAVAFEGGYRFTNAPWKPWVRGGIDYYSGDRDANDGTHETFVPPLPTIRRYSLSASYATMNLRDAFVQAYLKPHSRVSARVDLHRLDLAQAADRWYGGSGATQARGTYFGYSGRASQGATGLGTVLEGSTDVTISKYWSVNGYLGTIAGGPVIDRSFAGDQLTFFYLESVIAF